MNNLLELLRQGKNIYVGFYLDKDVDDNEVISILSNCESVVYKFNLDEYGLIKEKLLCDPYDYEKKRTKRYKW